MESAIPFHVPDLGPDELAFIVRALESGALGGDGPMSHEAEARLRELTGSRHALLTTSATHALELAVALLDLQPGAEVICPSFGFPSVANAILRHGGVPVFADVREDTLTLDPTDVGTACGTRTAAVVTVDYGGVASDMEGLRAVLPRAGIPLLVDAAHGIDAWRDGHHVGVDAEAAVLSFHATKNITCGEGGALLLQDDDLCRRAEILREKGTNRAPFLRGEVSFYEWVDTGSSYVLSDVLAALLLAQFERVKRLTARRRELATRYEEGFADLYDGGALLRHVVPERCVPNGHLYVIRTHEAATCTALRAHLHGLGIEAPFHFVPLHTSSYARRHLGPQRPLPVTERAWNTLLRLPIYPSLADADQQRVIAAVRSGLELLDRTQARPSGRSMHR